MRIILKPKTNSSPKPSRKAECYFIHFTLHLFPALLLPQTQLFAKKPRTIGFDDPGANRTIIIVRRRR